MLRLDLSVEVEHGPADLFRGTRGEGTLTNTRRAAETKEHLRKKA